MTAVILAEIAGLLVVAGVAVLEEGETPLAAWKRKVAEAVRRYDREKKVVLGDAVNADARRAVGPAPGVASDEVLRVQVHCTPDPDR